MSSVTQDNNHQSRYVILSIWECAKFDRRGEKGNKDNWYCGFCGNEYNKWNSTKLLMHLTISGGHRIYQFRGDILPKCQRHFKALNKGNKNLGIEGYQKGICCRHWFILMQSLYQHIFSQGKL